MPYLLYEGGVGRELTPEEIAELPEPDPPTLTERKSALLAAIDARRDQAFADGFTVAGTGTALDGQTLQTRSDEDKINWLTSQAAYSAAVAEGAGDVVDATFRTMSNATVVLTYSEGLGVLLAMAAWGKVIMGNSWTLKDVILAAEDHTALDVIDIGAGWP